MGFHIYGENTFLLIPKFRNGATVAVVAGSPLLCEMHSRKLSFASRPMLSIDEINQGHILDLYWVRFEL